MGFVVENQYDHPFRMSGRGNEKEIPAGGVKVLTDTEFEKIAWDDRGPGKIFCLYPSEATSENLKMKFDYYQPTSGVYEIRYIGYGRQDLLLTDEAWIIRRHSHTLIDGDYKVTEIQVLENVAWSERDSLAWT